MEFGRNGAVLTTDERLEIEHSGIRQHDFDLCVLGAAQLIAYAALAAAFAYLSKEWLSDPVVLTAMFVGWAAAVAPLAISFARSAVAYEELPEAMGKPPEYRHISGWLALGSLLVACVVGCLVILAATELAKNHNFEIPNDWGDYTIGAVVCAFLIAIFGPRLSNTPAAQAFTDATSTINGVFGWLGRCLSVVDSWLVFIIAPLAGVTQNRARKRYALLFCNLAPCGVLGWYLPAPFGLLPIAWAFLVVISVARRWAWVEEDREIAMLSANFSSENLRVGFDQDLSDESLWSYLSLIVLLPVAMHQCHVWSDGVLFAVKSSIDVNQLENPLAWLTFYGTELAKAVPFVDWTEIYDVHAASNITIGTVDARHVIFIARAVTDLALLAALLQALTIATRTRKQMRLFKDVDNSLDRLDPFVEPVELKKLVKLEAGTWVPIPDRVAKFPRYNTLRLHQLRLESDRNGPLYAAADALLKVSPEFSDAIENLLEVAGSKKRIDPEKLAAAFQAVTTAKAYDLDSLEYVRQALNWKAHVEQTRHQVASAIIRKIPHSPERTNTVRRMLADPHVADSLAAIRLMAIRALVEIWSVTKDQRIIEALKKAATHDASTPVENAAKEALETLIPAAKAPTEDEPV